MEAGGGRWRRRGWKKGGPYIYLCGEGRTIDGWREVTKDRACFLYGQVTI